MQIYSFSPFGYEGSLVTVEVDLRRGIPAVDLVGLADSAVKEARERMHAAIRNSGFDFPPERVLISLSPADLRKEGAGFDLPIALGVLYAGKNGAMADSEEASTVLDRDSKFISEDILIMGELELSGKVRPVKGVHAAVSTASMAGIRKCIVPSANATEAREVSGMQVFGADSLSDAFSALQNPEVFTMNKKAALAEEDLSDENVDIVEGVTFSKVVAGFEFSEIKGQQKLVRALQIAACGGHNLIAVGAPGCGKTMAIQKMPALMPLLTLEEAQSVTRIYSIAGLLQPNQPLVRVAPFRMPHQTATIEGICGGGVNCRPGEISLSHNGVLFLDEAAEFRSSVLQMLRVPLESGHITLCRAGRSTVFPASFQLVMASNPCPCGNYGSKTKICLCSARSIELYWKKFSGPLLDRVDLRVKIENESDKTDSVSTAELRKDIARGVKIQRSRQGKKNAYLTPTEILDYCKVSPEIQQFINTSCERYNLSPRAVSSCLKVSRTIADMEGSSEIKMEHIQEAISYRKEFADEDYKEKRLSVKNNL